MTHMEGSSKKKRNMTKPSLVQTLTADDVEQIGIEVVNVVEEAMENMVAKDEIEDSATRKEEIIL